MSTILYEDEKFLQIYESMACKGYEYAWMFHYPEGWQTDMSPHYQQFVDDLRVANIKAYNGRYDDGDELEYSLLDFAHTVSPYNDMRFYKSLKGLRYNLDDEDVNGCAMLLNKLIDAVASRIIERIPKYETADTW